MLFETEHIGTTNTNIDKHCVPQKQCNGTCCYNTHPQDLLTSRWSLRFSCFSPSSPFSDPSAAVRYRL